MKIFTTLFLTFIIFFLCKTVSAQENPFLKMAGKKYSEYSTQLLLEYELMLEYDSIQTHKQLSQLKEVAEKEGSVDWKLQVDFFEWAFSDKQNRLKNLNPTIEERIQPLYELIKKAQKAKVIQVELKCRLEIFVICILCKNYELAFEQADFLTKLIQDISSDDIPEKSLYNINIGNLHMDFKDYPKAISYYQSALNDKETASNQWYRLGALNSLGICYRYGSNDYDRSDSCFYAILNTRYFRDVDEKSRNNWDGIAEGNIGNNMYLRKEYDKAIPLLKSSIKQMLDCGDYAYSSGAAIQLASIYLIKGNLTETKRYIDLATEYYSISPRKSTLPSIYEVKSKYYATTGNAQLSNAYMDSSLSINKNFAEQFNALQMLRVEQRKFLSEKALKEEQLNTEKLKNSGYRRSLVLTLVGLLLIGGMFLRYLALYRKKQFAYQELVRRSQEWAQVKPEGFESPLPVEQADMLMTEDQENEIQNGLPDATDISITNEIERIMSEEKLYKDALLSVDMLAQKIGAKRYYVSMAINRCKKKSFNAFVNEYRVKEAVRLLSQKDIENFSIDYIAFISGFNDRINFYRVFKKMTGLSPTEFKKNIIV